MAIKHISLGAKRTQTTFSMMILGAFRVGKTKLAGGFPRPVFLSDKVEGGWVTLAHMPREWLYEPQLFPKGEVRQPGEFPDIIPIASPADMREGVANIKERVQKGGPDAPQTVVIDSATYYADCYLRDRKRANAAANIKEDGWSFYGALATHLEKLREDLHGLNINVVWICLDKETESADGVHMGIALPGQNAKKLGATCSFIVAMSKFLDEKGEIVYEMNTQTYKGIPIGGRDGGKLPMIIRNPDYRTIVSHLNA